MIFVPSPTCPRCGWRLDDHCSLGRVAKLPAFFCREKACGVAFARIGGSVALAYELDHDRQRAALELEIPRIQEREAALVRLLVKESRI